MKISRFFLLFTALSVSSSYAWQSSTSNYMNQQQAYTMVGYGTANAKLESQLDLSPRNTPIDGKAAFTFIDGYQLSNWLGLELGVTHIGVASDIFSSFFRVRSPIWNHFSLTAKYGLTLSNNLGRKVYGGGAQFYFTPEHAVGIEYTRQYAYFQEEVIYPDRTGGGFALQFPTDWQTDKQGMLPIHLFSLRYIHYLKTCDTVCQSRRDPAYTKGDYVGFAANHLSRHLTFGNVQNVPVSEALLTEQYSTRPQVDNLLGYSLVHGNQITPYFAMEFGITAAPKENYLNFYTFAGRFTLPLSNRIRPYIKAGALYTNETDFGWDLGLGADVFIDTKTAIGFAWDRLDTTDSAHEHYYDVVALSLRHYYGADAEDQSLSKTLSWQDAKSLSDQAVVVANQIQRGLYYSILVGSESASLTEKGPYHTLNAPLSGVGGTTLVGYGMPIKHGFYVGAEGYIGRSGSVFRPQTQGGGSSSHNLYQQIQYAGGNYFKDYFYGGRLLLGAINGNQNTFFAFAGPVFGDWSIKAHGITQVPKYRDRDSAFFFANADDLKGDGYLQTVGYQMGVAHEIPMTKKLFLRLQYDHTQFREETLMADTGLPLNLFSIEGAKYTYHLKSDLFQLGMKYRLGSAHDLYQQPKFSRYQDGWYVELSALNDFHHVNKRFGLVEPLSVYWDMNTRDEVSEFDVPRDYFVKGLAGQMLLSYRWSRAISDVDIVLGVEGGWSVMDSSFDYIRNTNYAYPDGNGDVFPSPDASFRYRAVNKGILGGLLGYQINPQDMLSLQIDYVSTLFKRSGFEGNLIPGSRPGTYRYRYFGRNFKHRIDGLQFTLGNDLAISHKMGIKLACAWTRYGSLRVEETHVTLSSADNSTVRNNYHNYRVTDMNYQLGLRYRIG